MTEITVEQCDRDAAASVAVLVEMRELILAGRADHHAEPFARHRIQHGAQSEPDLATIAYMSGAYDGRKDMAAQLAEAQREIERLRKALEPQWFYIDGWEENCLFSIYDAIDLADFEPGYHLLEVSTATPRPTIWCAVHVTDDDDVDDRFTFTEHASEAEARAALETKP